jgi:hypothetical protein
MPRSDACVKTINLIPFSALPIAASLCNPVCKTGINYARLWINIDGAIICNSAFTQLCSKLLHQNFALTFMNALLTLLTSTVERVGTIILSRSKVD